MFNMTILEVPFNLKGEQEGHEKENYTHGYKRRYSLKLTYALTKYIESIYLFIYFTPLVHQDFQAVLGSLPSHFLPSQWGTTLKGFIAQLIQ